ncbi:hypothetical protein [Enterobacter ludwigii]|uniref:hypothetical protein n=1 Tax=Enterobacter ludwigii TaxID=299767 RepID=UPI0018665A0B|nr:hypothetical protein [Enterobacter ludwigii]
MKPVMAGVILLLAQDVMADSTPMSAMSGNSVPLKLTLVVEQKTCKLTLLSPEKISFSKTPVGWNDLRGGNSGPIERIPPQTISLSLTECGSSAIQGQIPAIQVQGKTPFSEKPEIFRDDGSTASGLIGFGLRYQPDDGPPGNYLKNMDNVDVATSGMAPVEGTRKFLVDILYGGGEVGGGLLLGTLSFKFRYH